MEVPVVFEYGYHGSPAVLATLAKIEASEKDEEFRVVEVFIDITDALRRPVEVPLSVALPIDGALTDDLRGYSFTVRGNQTWEVFYWINTSVKYVFCVYLARPRDGGNLLAARSSRTLFEQHYHP